MRQVLVVEDDPLMRTGLAFQLKREGYAVTLAEDGEAALQLLNTNPFDLVITDVMMPSVSGIELLAHLEQLPKKPKVLLLTALHDENIVIKAFDLGAADFMTKPFSPKELSVRLQRLLPKTT